MDCFKCRFIQAENMKLRYRVDELTDLTEELMIENKQYRDTTDRLNDYIKSYETAIYRFDKANED